MIKVCNISKKFREITALSDLSFDCNKGEIFGLLGLNGAGKTTTLRILSTILKPDDGSINVLGIDVLKNPLEVRKIIGVLSSDVNLYARLTPYELINFFGKFYNLKEQETKKRIEEIANSLKMEDYLNRRMETFSTGMKRKVNLALCFIHQPPILLLDEPTAGLDIISTKRVREFIKQFKEENRIIILCSHNLVEVEEVCDRIGIIHQGKIIACGTFSELKAQSKEEKLEDIFINLVKEEDEQEIH